MKGDKLVHHYMATNRDIELRLGGQRALWGNVPSSLRAASVALEGDCIRFRAIFDMGASASDKELLSSAAAEIIADFEAPLTIVEEFLDIPAPSDMEHLQNLLFLRAEN
jgi:hypothetical protein